MKAKKCKHCKKSFEPFNSMQQVCGFECASKAYYKRQAEYKKAERIKLKESIKTLSDYKKDLQKEINTIVRLIDQGCSCLACGAKNVKVDASHYYSQGGWSNLRWNLFNIYSGCAQCNTYKSGNLIKFREGIIREFGINIMEFIEDLNVQYPFIKLNITELTEKISISRSMVRELKESNKVQSIPRSIKARIAFRKDLNTKLGIYT